MNELLGKRIKTLRIAKHFTQEQLAEKIGVSRQKYARIENGTNKYYVGRSFTNCRSIGCDSWRYNPGTG